MACATARLPLVHRVGGLADTVVDATAQNLEAGRATGIVFEEFSAQGLLTALRRAFDLRAHPRAWRQVQQTGMRQRFDWREAADHYVALYRSLMPHAAPIA